MTPIWAEPMHMITLPSQFKPMSISEIGEVRFLILIRLTLPVTLDLVCKRFRGVVYVVVTVVPSLVVLLLPLLELWPGGISSVGMTYTGSDADAMESEFLLRTMSLRSLKVVVTVVPSLTVVLPPLGKGCSGGRSSMGKKCTGSDTETMESESLLCARFLRFLKVVVTVVPSLTMVLPPLRENRSGGRSSEGMMCTGSDAPMMETRERSAFATGLAMEELMQRRAMTMALESHGW